MDPNFKSFLAQAFPNRKRIGVIAFRDKIKRRAKSKGTVQSRQPEASIHALLALNVMGEDKSKALALRPAGPPGGCFSGSFVNGPDSLESFPSPPSQHSAQCHPQPPRYVRFKLVIEPFVNHAESVWSNTLAGISSNMDNSKDLFQSGRTEGD